MDGLSSQAHLMCTSCGYLAEWWNVSDGDFDVENSMCEECLLQREEEELALGITHTDDGRRFATPITSVASKRVGQYLVADNSGNVESETAWNNALHDGIGQLPSCTGLILIECRKLLVLREIDLRGVGIKQQKLGYRKVQMKEFPQFVKSATSAASVMCGGGGGCGALQELQEEEEEQVVLVMPFSHDGVDYLKSSDGILYNPTSHDEVGVWNEDTQTITPIEDDESEEEEDEE